MHSKLKFKYFSKKWLNMMFNDKAKIEQYENLSK